MSDYINFEGTVIPTAKDDSGREYYQVQAAAKSIGIGSLNIPRDEQSNCIREGRLQYANVDTLIARLRKVGKPEAKPAAHRLIQLLSKQRHQPLVTPNFNTGILNLAIPISEVVTLCQKEKELRLAKKKIGEYLALIDMAKKLMGKEDE